MVEHMESWELRLRELMELATTDAAAAGIGVRRLFDDAQASSRIREALALARTLQVLLDTKEWYEDIAPLVRAQPPTGVGMTAVGFAEEQLGLLEAAFDSYGRAVVAEKLAGDPEILEIAVEGLVRILARRRGSSVEAPVGHGGSGEGDPGLHGGDGPFAPGQGRGSPRPVRDRPE